MNSEEATQIPIKPIKKTSVPEQIIHQLKSLIESGHIKPGNKLPAERDLAGMLAVSRPSLREALRALSLLGIIENRPGSGTYLATSFDKWPLDSFSIFLTINRGALIDIYEARKGMDGAIAGLAAQRRSEEDLRIMSRALKYMKANLKNNDEYARYELDFHFAVVEASKNLVIAGLMEKLYRLLQETRDHIYIHAQKAIGRLQQDYDNHKTIFNRIKDGDAEGATKAMIDHLLLFERDLMSQQDIQSR